MAEPREIRCYEYVNRPFSKVSRILLDDPVGFFQRATNAATTRAADLRSKLKVEVGGFEIDRDVEIEVKATETARAPAAPALPAIALSIGWRAAKSASLFPSMRADLTVYPLSADETQLDLHGFYSPPGGLLGNAADALVGHRIAEASVKRFLEDVVQRLSAEGK